MPDRDECLRMLDELLDLEDGLSAWELEFLESLNRVRETGWSVNQHEKLFEIHARENERGHLR